MPKRKMAMLAASILLAISVAVAGQPRPVSTTPQGQTVTFSEAEHRSEWLERGRQMNFLGRAPHLAWQHVEELRGSNLMVAGAIDLTTSRELIWPRGQWIVAIVSDSTEIWAKEIFTCGPRNEMRIFTLGRTNMKIDASQLHGGKVSYTNYSANPIYIAFPYTRVRDARGRTHNLGFSDIVSFRFDTLSDSLMSIVERR